MKKFFSLEKFKKPFEKFIIEMVHIISIRPFGTSHCMRESFLSKTT